MSIKDRIIYANLTEHWPADLRQLREENPDKCAVTDLDIKNFLVNMPLPQLQRLRGSKLAGTFHKNAQAAMDRITEKEMAAGNIRAPQYGRVASGGPKDLFAEPESGSSFSPEFKKAVNDKLEEIKNRK